MVETSRTLFIKKQYNATTMKPSSYRVLLVDDQPIYREGLKTLILSHPAVAQVGEASSEVEALAQLQSGKFNAVVTDLQLAQGSGFALIARAFAQDNAMKVVVLSVSKEADDAIVSIRKGASAYLGKGASGRDLLDALSEVFDGRSYLHPEIAHAVFRQIREDPILNPGLAPPVAEATAREKEIVALMCKGKTLQEISELLYLTPSTVKTHMRNLYHKWGVNSRSKLILRAMELSLHES